MSEDYSEEMNGEVDYPNLMQELETLCKCYQVASRDDKNVVWAALNKYVPTVMLQ